MILLDVLLHIIELQVDKRRKMNTIKINKHNSKVLKWLQSAASKDKNRPVLTGINIDKNYSRFWAVTADGWRLHIVPKDELEELPEGLRDYGKIPASGIIEEPDIIDGTFPDVLQIIPRKEPVLEIAVNSKFLIDTLKGLDSMAILKFHGANEPMEILGNIKTTEGSTPAYAVIMPITLEMAKQEIDWKP